MLPAIATLSQMKFEIIGNIYWCFQICLFVHIVHMIKLNLRIFVAFCTTIMMICSGEQVFVYGNFIKFSFFHRFITLHWMLNRILIIYTSYVMETFHKIKHFKFLQDMWIRIFIYSHSDSISEDVTGSVELSCEMDVTLHSWHKVWQFIQVAVSWVYVQ